MEGEWRGELVQVQGDEVLEEAKEGEEAPDDLSQTGWISTDVVSVQFCATLRVCRGKGFW